MESPTTPHDAIVLFDGVCHFCNGTVRFIARRDPLGYFAFAPLQSETGRRLLLEHGLPEDQLDTLVLIEEGRAFVRSTAALRIARRLRGWWPLVYGLRWVPRFIRDAAYGLFARYRYRLFGRSEVCMRPTPEIARRFLDDTVAPMGNESEGIRGGAQRTVAG